MKRPNLFITQFIISSCDWKHFETIPLRGGSETPQSWNREGRPPECRVNIRCWMLQRHKDIPFHQIKDLRGAAGVLHSPFHSILWESLRPAVFTLQNITFTLFYFNAVQLMRGRVWWVFNNILHHVQAFKTWQSFGIQTNNFLPVESLLRLLWE